MSTESQSSVFTRENAENILKPYIATLPDVDVMKLFKDFTDQYEHAISFMKTCKVEPNESNDNCTAPFKCTVPRNEYELYIMFAMLFQRLHQHQSITCTFQIERDGISFVLKKPEQCAISYDIVLSIIQKQAICIDFSSEELSRSKPVIEYDKDNIDALKYAHAFTLYTIFFDIFDSEYTQILKSCIEYRNTEPKPSDEEYNKHMSSLLAWNYTVPRKHFELYQVFAGIIQYRMRTKVIIDIICADE